MCDVIFENALDAIIYAYNHDNAAVLSVDRICEILAQPTLFIHSKNGDILPCSSITRRKISNSLAASTCFGRANVPRACLWARLPNSQHHVTDGQILSNVEQSLCNNGPMSIQQFVDCSELPNLNYSLFEHFFREHIDHFTLGEDGLIWFTGFVRPPQLNFENMNSALIYSFRQFKSSATVQQLYLFLCISTDNGKRISRRTVSRELSRSPDLFIHLARGEYKLNQKQELPPPPAINTNSNTNNSNPFKSDPPSFPSLQSQIPSIPEDLKPLELSNVLQTIPPPIQMYDISAEPFDAPRFFNEIRF